MKPRPDSVTFWVPSSTHFAHLQERRKPWSSGTRFCKEPALQWAQSGWNSACSRLHTSCWQLPAPKQWARLHSQHGSWCWHAEQSEKQQQASAKGSGLKADTKCHTGTKVWAVQKEGAIQLCRRRLSSVGPRCHILRIAGKNQVLGCTLKASWYFWWFWL